MIRSTRDRPGYNTISKVFEKALYIRLIERINNNNILKGQQFAIRKRLATVDVIFKLIHEILNALNNKVMVGSIFYDLEKAFDAVNNSLLIQKKFHFMV